MGEKANHGQDFANFCPFILKEYAKKSKPSNTTAKSARFGIANVATSATPHNEDLAKLHVQQDAKTAWAVSEIAKGLQKGNNEQIKTLVDLVGKLVTKLDNNSTTGNNGNNGNGNKGNRNRTNLANKAPCKHSNTVHTKPDNESWELEANAAGRPRGWSSRKTT